MRPYGYERDRKTIRDPEAAVLRAVAEKLLAGDSLRSVTAWINENEHFTSGGNRWKPNVLRRLLLAPRIAGKTTGKDGHLVDADWGPILDEITHKRLSEVLLDEARSNRSPSPARTYLLTGGPARCALCGHALQARPERGNKRGYVCASGPPDYGCGKIRINADLFENEVAERILARLLMPGSRAALRAAVDRVAAEAEAAPTVALQAESRQREAADLYAAGKITAGQLTQITESTSRNAAKARATVRLASQVQHVAGIALEPDPAEGDPAEQMIAWWESATREQKRGVIDTLVESIRVHPVVKRGSRYFDPDRVEVIWRR